MINIREKDFSKRTQKDYSLSFKLQIVDEIEKGYLTYKQSQKKVWSSGKKYSFAMVKKTRNFGLEKVKLQ
ncbi:MAG: hypothetical protein IPJ81_01240 [Chitinophagaceae bacterium]|nr:hypothetical protein [Chitinophagaceae bacterium]